MEMTSYNVYRSNSIEEFVIMSVKTKKPPAAVDTQAPADTGIHVGETSIVCR